MIHKLKKNSYRRPMGFTLIEILVVVVILGILAAIVVPKIMERPEQARRVRAQQDIVAIGNALDLYKLDNGFYPSTDQGLQALVNQPAAEPLPSNWHQYLKQLPVDPWGTPYHYLNPGQHGEVDIFTYGSTKQMNDKDIIANWNIK